MLRATLEVRRDLRRARGLLRAANVIGGPTEFFTLTVWTNRDAMYAFMSSGAHERIMWRWPEWLSSFWLGRLAPTECESGAWRGMQLAPIADQGGPVHPEFRSPSFASREPRPRDLEHHRLSATTAVFRPADSRRWPAGLSAARRFGRTVDGGARLLLRARGYSLDGELVSVALWRDELSAARAVAEASLVTPGVRSWAMAWRPLDEFGTWDGLRVRRLLGEVAAASP